MRPTALEQRRETGPTTWRGDREEDLRGPQDDPILENGEGCAAVVHRIPYLPPTTTLQHISRRLLLRGSIRHRVPVPVACLRLAWFLVHVSSYRSSKEVRLFVFLQLSILDSTS